MHKRLWALAAVLLASGPAAAADDACAKITGFTIDLTPAREFYLMPVAVAGKPQQFIFELNAAYTKMDQAIADGLPTKSLPRGMGVADSEGPFETIAKVPTLTIGPVTKKNAEVLIAPRRIAWGPASGVAGMNLFYGLDIELDLAHNRLGLYVPREDCDFTPFWPSREYGNADIKIAPTGAFYLPMYLDDKKLIVTLNTTERPSIMSFASARALFGIEENDPRLVQTGSHYMGRPVYRFPFKTLSGGHNVTVNSPEIYVVADEKTCGGIRDQSSWNTPWANKCFGSGDLRLGSNLLKKLHFFFEVKKKKAYFTLAEPPAAP